MTKAKPITCHWNHEDDESQEGRGAAGNSDDSETSVVGPASPGVETPGADLEKVMSTGICKETLMELQTLLTEERASPVNPFSKGGLDGRVLRSFQAERWHTAVESKLNALRGGFYETNRDVTSRIEFNTVLESLQQALLDERSADDMDSLIPGMSSVRAVDHRRRQLQHFNTIMDLCQRSRALESDRTTQDTANIKFMPGGTGRHPRPRS